MYEKLEDLEYLYLSLLQDKLPAALDAVEAYWAARGDPLPLPDIRQWHTGNITPGYLSTIVQKLPALTVEATSLAPTPNRETAVALVDSLVLTVYVRGNTPQQTNKLAHRYAAALANVVAVEKPQGVKGLGKLTMAVGESVDITRANYFKDAQVSVPLVIGAPM
jgi:hypothetical protein